MILTVFILFPPQTKFYKIPPEKCLAKLLIFNMIYSLAMCNPIPGIKDPDSKGF